MRARAMNTWNSEYLMEEVSWRQKSREIWFEKGDRNSKVFHKMTNTHRRRNFLAKIKVMGSSL